MLSAKRRFGASVTSLGLSIPKDILFLADKVIE